MKITKFAQKVSRLEKGSKEVDVAQIMEILSVINKLTGGVFYGVVKLLTIAILVAGLSSQAKATDIITSTLLDHVMTVTQFTSGQTNLALVDSVVQVGSINNHSILDLQLGFNGNVAPDPEEPTGTNLIAGGFFKVSSFLKDKVKFPEQWVFLNSIEHGPYLHYDFRNKDWFGGYQVGLAFNLEPKP